MKYAEVKQKTKAEAHTLIAESREALRKARFSVGQKQLKNVRTIRTLKKTIARALTHASHTSL